MKLKQYLHTQLAHTFFPIFLSLYFITSIIFLVKIASLTSVITINTIELFELYAYIVPIILFYTLPISFFMSLVITLSKLSSEYELIVITSFGLNPLKIVKIFFPITLFLSLALVVISVGLIPKTKYLNDVFIKKKEKEANFNIKSSEFGQKFGNWLIYINSKEDKTYKDVKLFKTLQNEDQFIISKRAKLDNENGELSFRLLDGKSFNIKDEEFNQINYKQMIIKDSIDNNRYKQFTNSYEYWKKWLSKGEDVDDFTFYVLTSFFPLLSLFLVVSFGYFNPRYEKNKSVAFALVSVVFFYTFMKALTENLLLHSLYVVPLCWIGISYFYYTKSVKKRY